MITSFENLGTANANKVYVGNLAVWFSYRTPVGFAYNGKRVCRVNDWSTTTGKLLNAIEPDHSKRVDGPTFERLLHEAEIENARDIVEA